MSQPINAVNARFPDYRAITGETVGSIVDSALAMHAAEMEAIMALDHRTVDNTLIARERVDAALATTLGAVNHLSTVADTPDYRDAYNAAQSRISAYHAALNQNERLLAAIRQAGKDPQASSIEQRVIELTVRGFKLSGVDLPPAKRKRFADISTQLSELSTAYGNAMIDATEAWTRPLSEADLAGLPGFARDMLAGAARERGEQGWLATPASPISNAILTFSENRELRADVHRAASTRASDQGPNAGEFDNSERMGQILMLRRETAALLGFSDSVADSLATKMATDQAEVLTFLDDLAESVRPAAERELEVLRCFAADELDIADLQLHDIAFASERLRQRCDEIDEEEITRYFPIGKVLDGLNLHLEETFGVTLQAALGLVRRIDFAVLDLELHLMAKADPDDNVRLASQVRQRYSPLEGPAWIRFPHSFSHIFAGGYATGYYSYLWAERISADAFEAFLENGVDQGQLGRRFRREVLALGATRPAHDSYAAFRGRGPDSGALLRQRGLAA